MEICKRATIIKDYAYTITERQDRCPAQIIDCGNGKYRFLTELDVGDYLDIPMRTIMQPREQI